MASSDSDYDYTEDEDEDEDEDEYESEYSDDDDDDEEEEVEDEDDDDEEYSLEDDDDDEAEEEDEEAGVEEEEEEEEHSGSESDDKDEQVPALEHGNQADPDEISEGPDAPLSGISTPVDPVSEDQHQPPSIQTDAKELSNKGNPLPASADLDPGMEVTIAVSSASTELVKMKIYPPSSP